VETVGDRIRQRRLELGLSQEEIARRSLVSTAYVSLLELNSRRPSAKTLRKLAPRLGVSAYWLETGRDDPAEQHAQLVLIHDCRPPIPEAVSLAKAVLRERWNRASPPAAR
jgi:transcriptional regulator with XRE-family HTH domain